MSEIVESNDIEKKKRGRPRKAVEEVKEKKPKPAIPKTSTKEYYREFYHQHKQEVQCKFCCKTYASRNGFLNHQKNNKTCFIIQVLKLNEDKNIEEGMESKASVKFKKLVVVED